MVNKQLAIVVGTRPDIIKLSPIIRYCEKNKVKYSLIHTGQHYNSEMDSVFFKDLNLPAPDINIRSSSSLKKNNSLDQTAVIMNKLKKVFINEKIGLVMVLGDTNSALAASIISRRLDLKLAHVEAGLRSFDERMQEEHNRIMIDHIADFNFAPTKTAVNHMLNEGISREKIFLVGNTIVDAVYQNIKIAEQKSDILRKLGIVNPLRNIVPYKFILVTSHRPENVDHPDRLRSIIAGLDNLASKMICEREFFALFFPIHPRTLKRMKEFNINKKDYPFINFITPPGYLDFLTLESYASLIITDSGGIQEEACILKRPCVTIRETTERPETLEIGCNILAGVESQSIVNYSKKMLNKKINYKNPFGDGKSADYIMKILKKKMY